jgi:hypothetical protein
VTVNRLKKWLPAIIKVLSIALAIGGGFMAYNINETQAVMNAGGDPAAVSWMDAALTWLSTIGTGGGIAAFLPMLLSWAQKKFLPWMDETQASNLPQGLTELVAAIVALATNTKSPKLWRAFFQEFLDVAFIFLAAIPFPIPPEKLTAIRQTLSTLSAQIHEALGPGSLPTPLPPLPEPPIPAPANVTLAETMR